MRQKHETAINFNQLKAITEAFMLKKGALKPTKRAFSERQITAFRDNSQASTNKSQETEQANQQGDNANAKKSAKAFKQGLTNTQSKGGQNEA
ncbi:hypothetical protein EC565_07445 [Helicobacter pylori]|uniref:hypothetical protein n=1 Tax=Helicobacter pylori TaxID=210 RepID=UPI000FDF0364|nr:hypothetical protein [Helicobacter pylori]RVZ56760.1 hypothetical protein EC565_07445 [Helicobacter pylori]